MNYGKRIIIIAFVLFPRSPSFACAPPKITQMNKAKTRYRLPVPPFESAQTFDLNTQTGALSAEIGCLSCRAVILDYYGLFLLMHEVQLILAFFVFTAWYFY